MVKNPSTSMMMKLFKKKLRDEEALQRDQYLLLIALMNTDALFMTGFEEVHLSSVSVHFMFKAMKFARGEQRRID
ncbi:MAG: hypothetical protein JSW05_00145 [Candidatus Thorarchaeota archaeon]|nr:MAG: hypothetical protein JSW05_00145 [Candidatus Thorarchaeota archaeon]